MPIAQVTHSPVIQPEEQLLAQLEPEAAWDKIKNIGMVFGGVAVVVWYLFYRGKRGPEGW